MALNKALIDMYKQRSRINSKSAHPKIKDSPVSNNSITAKKPKVEYVLDSMDYRPQATFDKMYGCDDARDRVLKSVEHFRRLLTESTKIISPLPVLICGSRGLGKTSIVESAANYAKLRLIRIPLNEIKTQPRNLFEVTLKEQKKHCFASQPASQPAIVLIDDLDRIEGKEHCGLLASLIQELSKADKLLVFCTTSSGVDSNLGITFRSKIKLRRPSLGARLSILESLRNDYSNFANLSEDDLKSLAVKTPSFSPFDLKEMLAMAETESESMPCSIDHCERAVEEVKQSFETGTHLIGERPSITWNDIGGLTEVRDQFARILRRLKRGHMDYKFGGIALYGPPGCGKTMVAQAMANEAGFNFISIKSAELVDKFLGETEKNIRRVFREAQEYEPCMIYFDEFDGLCGTRGNKDTVTAAIQTLLAEMDGFVNRGKIIVLIATNRLEDIDPAMIRPGRLSKHIYVGPPNEQERKDILYKATKKSGLALAEDVDLGVWAKKTENFTGAELAFLISEAENEAEDKLYREDPEANYERIVISEENLKFAMHEMIRRRLRGDPPKSK